MNRGKKSFVFLSIFLMMLCCDHVYAQDIAHLRGKKHLLKGKWQLVSSFSEGKEHAVAKEEYDGTITFRSFHRYTEEVNYESYHWIIKGKWKVYRNKATLSLTHRQYTLGELEKNPADIIFDLIQLDKTHWQASSTAKGALVKMTYQGISKKPKK